MTDKLRELVERLENSSPYGFNLHHEAAAALRELIEQKPVVWRAETHRLNRSPGYHYNLAGDGEPLYALPVAQPSNDHGFDRAASHNAGRYVDTAEPSKSALQQYNELNVNDQESDPLERLRAFCSLAMRGDDWLDVEPFFWAVKAAQPSKEWLDEAMRLYDEGVQEACVPADNVKEHVDNFRAGLKARAALREHLEKR